MSNMNLVVGCQSLDALSQVIVERFQHYNNARDWTTLSQSSTLISNSNWIELVLNFKKKDASVRLGTSNGRMEQQQQREGDRSIRVRIEYGTGVSCWHSRTQVGIVTTRRVSWPLWKILIFKSSSLYLGWSTFDPVDWLAPRRLWIIERLDWKGIESARR